VADGSAFGDDLAEQPCVRAFLDPVDLFVGARGLYQGVEHWQELIGDFAVRTGEQVAGFVGEHAVCATVVPVGVTGPSAVAALVVEKDSGARTADPGAVLIASDQWLEGSTFAAFGRGAQDHVVAAVADGAHRPVSVDSALPAAATAGVCRAAVARLAYRFAFGVALAWADSVADRAGRLRAAVAAVTQVRLVFGGVAGNMTELSTSATTPTWSAELAVARVTVGAVFVDNRSWLDLTARNARTLGAFPTALADNGFVFQTRGRPIETAALAALLEPLRITVVAAIADLAVGPPGRDARILLTAS